MRKLNKSKILSSKYKEWLDNLDQSHENHGTYNSTNNVHYIDVVMNLLHVQRGLCAFTEVKLCSQQLIDEKNWVDGKYINRKPEILGQLDHWNPDLKKEKSWNWDNFFYISSDINIRVKSKKVVDEILKPDTENYDPIKFLEYDAKSHIFIPNSNLDKIKYERVKKMILILGINYDPIIDLRKEYLEDKLACKRFGLDYEINQFVTAYSMISKV